MVKTINEVGLSQTGRSREKLTLGPPFNLYFSQTPEYIETRYPAGRGITAVGSSIFIFCFDRGG